MAHLLAGSLPYQQKAKGQVGAVETDWKNVLAGFIQGSVLGPILFILSIADINDYIPPEVSLQKYADDILCYIIVKQTTNGLPQSAADGIGRWSIPRLKSTMATCPSQAPRLELFDEV